MLSSGEAPTLNLVTTSTPNLRRIWMKLKEKAQLSPSSLLMSFTMTPATNGPLFSLCKCPVSTFQFSLTSSPKAVCPGLHVVSILPSPTTEARCHCLLPPALISTSNGSGNKESFCLCGLQTASLRLQGLFMMKVLSFQQYPLNLWTLPASSTNNPVSLLGSQLTDRSGFIQT